MSEYRPRIWIGRGAAASVPRRIPDPPRRVLLASTGNAIDAAVIRQAVELATPQHARITVLGIARVYGTSLGLPHPGLQPNRIEWEELRSQVEGAATALRGRGFEVRVALARSRNTPKLIARWVAAKNFHAVVVGDRERPRWRVVIEGELAHEIERRCGVPVHVVPLPRASSQGSARPA